MANDLNYKTALSMLPHHMRQPMLRYIEKGLPPGHFLSAVLSNDLKEAVAHADGTNEHYLPEYVRYLMWYAPLLCWGSRENMNVWAMVGGLEGQKKETV